jgi:hypothetical protein
MLSKEAFHDNQYRTETYSILSYNYSSDIIHDYCIVQYAWIKLAELESYNIWLIIILIVLLALMKYPKMMREDRLVTI